MPTYDSDQFDPPAPVATVTVRNPDTGTTVANVLMLIDTGADVTLIPRTVVEQLGISTLAENPYELMAFDGSLSSSPAIQAEIVFLRRAFRGQFLLIDQPVGVLGRNVLNTLRLVFDGPQLTWDEA